ncbi:hypothetical protein CRYUN_Cryun08bG0098600 [Craigia yunnanensis]
MHLMELSERSSAISMIHKARKNGLPFWNKRHEDQDQMAIAFEAYQHLRSVIVHPMTAISALNSIHEIFALVQIEINQRVFRHVPCFVGTLLDRGLGGTTQVVASEVSYSVVLPFFGGQDDREALS